MGNRILGRHPEWLEWQVVQNANAYEEGFTAAWDAHPPRALGKPEPRDRGALEPFLELDGVKLVYLHGHRDPDAISPDNWNMDLHFLARPNAHRVQLDLFYDYRTNVELYPQWQAFLRERRPPTLILWGENDIIFTPKAAGPTCATCPTPSCTCSTAATSPSRTPSKRSRSTSSDSTPSRSSAAPAQPHRRRARG